MTHPIQKYLHDSGYAPGDALSGGPGRYTTLRLLAAVGAALLFCAGALFARYELAYAGMVLGGGFFVAQMDASQSPPLRLESAGIRRGNALIPWADVRGCHRTITGKQAFIEFTFTNADGREQTQRSLAAPALYRQHTTDNEPKPEGDEENVARAAQATYRSAPPVIAPLVVTPKEPRTSWWRALVRLVWGRR
jgi:hypothetical protein